MTLWYDRWQSPVGVLHMVGDATHLRVLAYDANWPRLRERMGPMSEGETALSVLLKRELSDYFAGRRRRFTVPLRPQGTTFQLRVWDALGAIPYGATASYRDQAQTIGQPAAVRAVGHANGQNPISILVPCHRVIASSGALAGYAGGLPAKEFLLTLERAAHHEGMMKDTAA